MPLATMGGPPAQGFPDPPVHHGAEQGAKIRIVLDLLVDIEVGVDHVFQRVAEERIEREFARLLRRVYASIQRAAQALLILKPGPMFSAKNFTLSAFVKSVPK